MKAINWYYTKEQLLSTVTPTHDIYFISEDSKQNTASKNFTYFNSGTDIISYIESVKKPHIYEIIYDTRNYPCYLYFDMDRKVPFIVTSELYETIVNRFQYILIAFVKDIYKQDISLKLGETIQVAYTNSPLKVSLHIKVNIIFPNLELMSSFVKNLDKYMCNSNYTSSEDRALFYTYINEKYTPLIDHAVYSNFRSYRTLTSSKWKHGALPLLPWGKSSLHIKDHLVRVYKDISRLSI